MRSGEAPGSGAETGALRLDAMEADRMRRSDLFSQGLLRTLGIAAACATSMAFVALGCGYHHSGGDYGSYGGPVSLTAVSPAAGTQAGGTQVTLYGSGFQSLNYNYSPPYPVPYAANAGAVPAHYASGTVYFGGVAAWNVVVSADGNSISCYTPPNFNVGTVDVSVVNGNFSSVLPRAYTYSDPGPSLSSVTPSSAPSGAPTSVSLSGANFLAAYPFYYGGPYPLGGGLAPAAPQGGTNTAVPGPYPRTYRVPTVTVGGQVATNVTVVSPSQITCTFPDDSNGAKDVIVTNPDGKSVTLAGGFTRQGTIQRSLQFTTAIASTPVNQTLPQITVTVVDQSGNVIGSATDNITISIGTNPGSGMLHGTVTVAASGGTAVFTDLSIDRTGNGYTLVASLVGGQTATSNSFNIN
jgi:hypothetical protein